MFTLVKSVFRGFASICSWAFPYSRVLRMRQHWNGFRSMWLRRGFAAVGEDVYFGKVGLLKGQEYISLGNHISIDDFFFLTAWDRYLAEQGEQQFMPVIRIGNHCSFGVGNHISATQRIEIGDGCLTGKWVTIVDNSHGGCSIGDLALAPALREIVSKGPVSIGKNVWIGDKATILAGVTIGDGAIIAANAVVTKDIPAYSVAAGVPATVIRQAEKKEE